MSHRLMFDRGIPPPNPLTSEASWSLAKYSETPLASPQWHSLKDWQNSWKRLAGFLKAFLAKITAI